MPCEILVRATNHPNGKWLKGFPVVVKDDPVVWGGQEGPPNYVKVRITDASAQEVENFLANWRNVIEHEIVAENDLGYRIRLSMSVRIAQVFPERGMRQEIRNYLESTWGALLVSSDANSATFDIPKPVDLQAVRRDLIDKFEEQIDPVRYMFSSADVDLALAQLGVISITRAQAMNRIIDRTV